MTNFSKRIDGTHLEPGRRTVLRAGLAACAAIAVAWVTAGQAFALPMQAKAERPDQAQQADRYGSFLARYAQWVVSIEAEGQERGSPLTPAQREMATEIGIERPDKVRLVLVDAVPFPTEDAAMREIGEKLGFIGPGVVNNAQAFGYTIWVRDGFVLDRPGLAHELVHVWQIERSADFAAYLQEYMGQLRRHGHEDMPLEIEAYAANLKYACDKDSREGEDDAVEDLEEGTL